MDPFGFAHRIAGDVKTPLLNVLTAGEYEHPGGLEDYGKSIVHSFDPRTREGLTNWAGILVPGGRGRWAGKPTIEQQSFLDAIAASSRGEPEAQAAQMGVSPSRLRPRYDL